MPCVCQGDSCFQQSPWDCDSESQRCSSGMKSCRWDVYGHSACSKEKSHWGKPSWSAGTAGCKWWGLWQSSGKRKHLGEQGWGEERDIHLCVNLSQKRKIYLLALRLQQAWVQGWTQQQWGSAAFLAQAEGCLTKVSSACIAVKGKWERMWIGAQSLQLSLELPWAASSTVLIPTAGLAQLVPHQSCQRITSSQGKLISYNSPGQWHRIGFVWAA